MTGVLFYLPNARQLSNAGAILPGWKASFFISDTDTPTAVYEDGDLQTPLTQPVVADVAGMMQAFYLDPSVIYRVKLFTASDVLIDDVDPFDVSRSESGAIDQFIELLDCPSSYAGEAGKVPAVNDGENALEFVDIVRSTDVQVFDASGTWNKPANAKTVTVITIGGGGGGASAFTSIGAAGAAGGSGGGGGGVSERLLKAVDLPSTVAVTVGAGGAGGAVQNAGGNTIGLPGVAGGASSFANLVESGGGGFGIASSSSTNVGGAGGAGSTLTGGTGDGSQATTTDQPARVYAPSGGGAGGGKNSGGTAFEGAHGAAIGVVSDLIAGGAGGVSPGGVGADGNDSTTLNFGSGGGGGGASVTATAAGAGGDGGFPGGGGGGGGACTTGTNTGAGGAGAHGRVIVITSF